VKRQNQVKKNHKSTGFTGRKGKKMETDLVAGPDGKGKRGFS